MGEPGFLQGMNAIAQHVGFSENTVLKHKRSYPGMPIEKICGIWVGDPKGLTEFYCSLARGDFRFTRNAPVMEDLPGQAGQNIK